MAPLKAVEAFLKEEGIARDEEITVAFSGGYDSLCLLACLSTLSQRCRAVYVDHNIRGREELSREIEKNRANCRVLGVEMEVVTIPQGRVEALSRAEKTTCEAVARLLRYEILKERGLVATAHNLDDQCETLLMRLVGGCTLLSLAGIRKRRGNIIRPLLEVSRKEIEAYVDSLGLEPSQDSTNSSLFYMRNRIRHILMPTISPEAKDSLVSIAKNLQTVEAGLRGVEIEKSGAYWSFSRKAFLSLNSTERARVLFALLECVSSERVSLALLERMGNAIEKATRLDERTFILTVSGDSVRFYKSRCWFASPFKEGVQLPYGLTLQKSADAKALRIDTSLLEDPILRMGEEGDAIIAGGRKISIQSMLSSSKCPYAVVLEDRQGIRAVFASAFGGKDRIADSMRSAQWQTVDGFVIC